LSKKSEDASKAASFASSTAADGQPSPAEVAYITPKPQVSSVVATDGRTGGGLSTSAAPDVEQTLQAPAASAAVPSAAVSAAAAAPRSDSVSEAPSVASTFSATMLKNSIQTCSQTRPCPPGREEIFSWMKFAGESSDRCLHPAPVNVVSCYAFIHSGVRDHFAQGTQNPIYVLYIYLQ